MDSRLVLQNSYFISNYKVSQTIAQEHFNWRSAESVSLNREVARTMEIRGWLLS